MASKYPMGTRVRLHLPVKPAGVETPWVSDDNGPTINGMMESYEGTVGVVTNQRMYSIRPWAQVKFASEHVLVYNDAWLTPVVGLNRRKK